VLAGPDTPLRQRERLLRVSRLTPGGHGRRLHNHDDAQGDNDIIYILNDDGAINVYAELNNRPKRLDDGAERDDALLELVRAIANIDPAYIRGAAAPSVEPPATEPDVRRDRSAGPMQPDAVDVLDALYVSACAHGPRWTSLTVDDLVDIIRAARHRLG
jgi:hypothetical protein